MSDILGWASAIGATIAAALVAARITPLITGLAFVLFSLSSAGWVVTGALEGENSLIFQNVILTAINLYGVYRWLIWQPNGGEE